MRYKRQSSGDAELLLQWGSFRCEFAHNGDGDGSRRSVRPRFSVWPHPRWHLVRPPLASADAPPRGNAAQVRTDLRALGSRLCGRDQVDGNPRAAGRVGAGTTGYVRIAPEDEAARAAEQRALGHFPSVLDLRYAAAFAPLSCVDKQLARTVNVLQEFTQRRFKAGHGNGNRDPFASVVADLRTAKRCNDAFKREAATTTSVARTLVSDLQVVSDKLVGVIKPMQARQRRLGLGRVRVDAPGLLRTIRRLGTAEGRALDHFRVFWVCGMRRCSSRSLASLARWRSTRTSRGSLRGDVSGRGLETRRVPVHLRAWPFAHREAVREDAPGGVGRCHTNDGPDRPDRPDGPDGHVDHKSGFSHVLDCCDIPKFELLLRGACGRSRVAHDAGGEGGAVADEQCAGDPASSRAAVHVLERGSARHQLPRRQHESGQRDRGPGDKLSDELRLHNVVGSEPDLR